MTLTIFSSVFPVRRSRHPHRNPLGQKLMNLSVRAGRFHSAAVPKQFINRRIDPRFRDLRIHLPESGTKTPNQRDLSFRLAPEVPAGPNSSSTADTPGHRSAVNTSIAAASTSASSE